MALLCFATAPVYEVVGSVQVQLGKEVREAAQLRAAAWAVLLRPEVVDQGQCGAGATQLPHRHQDGGFLGRAFDPFASPRNNGYGLLRGACHRATPWIASLRSQ